MDIYREQILDHWQNPQNWGQMRKADLIIDQVNPLCGDEIRFFIKLSVIGGQLSDKSLSTGRLKSENRKQKTDNYLVSDISFTGNGCAISIASASILSEMIKGKTLRELAKITGKDVLELLGGSVGPARLKCAFLPLEALRKAQGKLLRKIV